MIDAPTLRSLLSYDPDTGIFIWLRRQNRNKAGSQAGSKRAGDGHIVIRISGRSYLAHRLAWFYTHGYWPCAQIDHINCDPSDNRLANLRECRQSQNNANVRRHSHNTSGFKGVAKAPRGMWRAQIQVNGKQIYLGQFATKELAHAAYVTAAKKYFGEFARAA